MGVVLEGARKLFPPSIKRGIRVGYNYYLRPVLPHATRQYNGVTVQKGRVFDSSVPWIETSNRPQYESGLGAAIQEYVDTTDSVVIVAGGLGVTAVKAAEQVGELGQVTVYEAAADYVEKVRTTLSFNGMLDRVKVVHGVVGQPVNLSGPSKGATAIQPDDLPECDILELDCEGAEIDILEQMAVRPSVLLVETHGHYGAPSDHVKQLMENKGYKIHSQVVADERIRDHCIDNDICPYCDERLIS